jgi:hypothetical protein
MTFQTSHAVAMRLFDYTKQYSLMPHTKELAQAHSWQIKLIDGSRSFASSSSKGSKAKISDLLIQNSGLL